MFVKAISGIPFSITAHGQDFMSDLGNDELLRELCASAKFVGAETDYSRDMLAARCPESGEKIFRVYNGIDLARFPIAQTKRHSVGPIRFLSTGRLIPFKGFEVLIDACAQLQDRALNFACEIIGHGPLRADLEGRVVQHNLQERIHFADEQSQNYVLRALRNSDIFVLASAPVTLPCIRRHICFRVCLQVPWASDLGVLPFAPVCRDRATMERTESVPAAWQDIHVAAAFSADRARRGRFHVRAVPARAFPHRKTFVKERGNANRDSRDACQERKPENASRKEKNAGPRFNYLTGHTLSCPKFWLWWHACRVQFI